MEDTSAEQLLIELDELRRKNAELERIIAGYTEIREDLHRAQREKDTLNRITSILLGSENDEMYGEVLKVILGIMASRDGLFGYVAGNGDLVIPGMTREAGDTCHPPGETCVFPPAAWGESIWGRAMREGCSFTHHGPFQTPLGHFHIANSLAVPVIHGKEVIGLISVSNREPGYTEDDKRLLEDIASSIAPILKARLQRDRQEQQHRLADEALHASEAQLSNALEIARAGHWEYDVASDTFTFNDHFYRIFRTSAEKMGGYRMSSADYARRFCHPDDAALVGSEIRTAIDAMDGMSDRQIEHRIIFGDGEIGYIAVRFFVVKDREGRTVRTCGVNQDITGRKKAEEERLAHLRFFESMDRVNRAFQGKTDPERMMGETLDVVLGIFECDRACLLYPCDPEAASWRCPVERTRPDSPGFLAMGTDMPMDTEVAEAFRILNASDGPVTFGPGTDHPLPEALSQRFDIRSIMSLSIHPTHGKPWQFGIHQCSYPRAWKPEEQKLFQEIGRRLADTLSTLLTYRELRESEEKFKSLTESAQDAIIMIDDEGCIRYWNDAAERIFGWAAEEIVGKDIHATLAPQRYCEAFRKGLAEFRKTGSGSVFGRVLELRACKKNRQEFPAELSISRLFFQGSWQAICILRDITERKKLEDQLRQSQKMEAIGRLAGGIAHDFNNILTALTGYGSLLKAKMDENDSLHRYVNEILSAAHKATDLTQGLLAFSRQQPVTFRPHDINDLIRGSEKLLKRLVSEDVIIQTDLVPGQPIILADATQIDQVLFNLASNARDAMPKGGILIIETKSVALDDEFRRLHGFGKPGKYVLLSVSDSGMGMDEGTRERIFDPFFTTKESGKGTGLGLSTVYGIVKQHDGYITVYSEPGLGTTFNVYFPVVNEAVEDEQSTPAPVKGGTEAILVAEDNAAVRDLITEVLTLYGYTVIEASDGVEAVERFQKSERIDLLILDSIMPGKNGRETYNEISRIQPGIRVLFTSGYTRDIILDKGIEDRLFHFVSKPIQPVTLLNKVREILDQ